MRLLALAATASLLLVTPAAPASSFPETTQWVLTSAKVPVPGGPSYITSLRIVNPGTQAARVQLTYRPQSVFDMGDPANFRAPGDNSGAVPVEVPVPAGRTVAIEDVILTTFGDPAPFGVHAGGIYVVSDVPVSVFSRTYVANGRSETGVPGTFGISIPSVSADLAVSLGDTAYLPYVAVSPDVTRGYRTNFIMLNTVSAATVLHARVTRADGSVVGERDYTLAPLAAAQQANIAGSFGYGGPDESMTVAVTVKSGGPVVVGLTPIDNAINSQNFAAPSKVFAPNNGLFGLVLDDGPWGFSGRLDIAGGLADFLTAGIVLDSCPSGPTLFFVQAISSGTGRNTDFTRNQDGSWSFTGLGTSATWSGNVFPWVDGTVYGDITYQRASSASSCPGVWKTVSFYGARAVPITPK